MTEATARDYWISATALYIELNALGDPDYIQASCVNDTKVLAFMKGIDALEYDAGHNYRRWSLQASPTVFNSHSEKYVYIAIPRDPNTNKGAFVAFPSEKIDLYGLNEAGDQVGSASYYYIFTQGVISSSGTDGRTSRTWVTPVNTGTLSSDEAVKAATGDGTWWEWNAVSNCVKFLKDISEATISILTLGKLKFNGSVINGVANDSTASTADDVLVTPNWGDAHYLSSVNEDTAAAAITFAKGAKFGENTDYSISEAGAAKLATAAISDSVGNGDFVSGYAAGSGWSVYSTLVDKVKKWTLEIDNLVVRSALKVYEMVVSQLVGENDNRIFAACGEVVVVSSRNYMCHISTENGGKLNPFRVGDILECQKYQPSGDDTSKHYRLTVTGLKSMTYNGEQVVRVTFSDFTDLTGSGGYYYDLMAAGDTLVRVDSTSDESRKGIVGITSVGEKTPYLDVIYGKTTETNPLKVRMGNLSGVTDENFGGALSGWGLYAENAYLKGAVYATSGTFNGKVYATDGEFKGKVTATSGEFNGTVNATDGTFKGRIEAEEGYFNNGTFDNATVTGTITATAGKIAGYTIEGNMLTYADTSTRYKGWISPESICLYQSPQGGGAAERSVEIGNGNDYGVTDGVTYALKIVTRQYAISTGLSINLQNKDSTDSITGETAVDNFAKYALKLYGGSIGGLKLHTAILNGGTDENPTEIGLLDSVVILQSGGSYKFPDFGTKTQYDGHVVMVRVMTSDNIKLYASGNNKILHERWDIDSCWGVNYAGLSATFVFVPAYTDSNSGAQGVWIEFRNSWNF